MWTARPVSGQTADDAVACGLRNGENDGLVRHRRDSRLAEWRPVPHRPYGLKPEAPLVYRGDFLSIRTRVPGGWPSRCIERLGCGATRGGLMNGRLRDRCRSGHLQGCGAEKGRTQVRRSEGVNGSIDASCDCVTQTLNSDGVIFCGHPRWKAAAKLGLARVPIHVSRDQPVETTRIPTRPPAETVRHWRNTWRLACWPIRFSAGWRRSGRG